MSWMVIEPELVTAAAENLAGIGSGLGKATAVAAAPTTGVAAAAGDEVSAAISRVFGSYGRQFQAATAQAAAFHDEFVSLLNGGAAAYLGTELANVEQTLTSAASAPAAAATAFPDAAYAQLFANTSANLNSLYGAWKANPFPILRQVLVNQLGYLEQIEAALAATIHNLPAVLASLPANIQAGIHQLLTFPAAYYAQQIIAAQIGFAQSFATNLHAATTGIVAGLPAFNNGLQVAWQAVRAGDYYGAVQDVAQAFANLMVTGFDQGTPTISVTGFPLNTVVNVTVNPTLLGPLGNLFDLGNIPGQEAQYFTNLMPPSILRQMSQNLTNALNALTIPSISATATLPLANIQTGSLSVFFGLPLQLTYAAAGGPFAALEGLATSATTVQQALLAGNPVGALNALVDAPAVVANGFLNGQTIVDMTIPVSATYTPTPPPPPLPPFPPLVIAAQIVLHLPFDGILVPPHPLTATLYVTSPITAGPFPSTIFGTPFMGLVPLLVNYLPQQLAAAITPTG